MRIKDILNEAPLGGIETYGDFEPRDKTSMRINPDTATNTIDNPSKRLLTGKLDKYVDAFAKTPYTINFYVYSHPEFKSSRVPGLPAMDNDTKAKIYSSIRTKGPEDINVIITTNVTNARTYRPLTPWMLAHRLAHAMQFQQRTTSDKWDFSGGPLTANINGILDKLYQHISKTPHWWFDEGSNKRLTKVWSLFGTMQTARSGQGLTNTLDATAEFVAQYLLTGQVTLRVPDQQEIPHVPIDKIKLLVYQSEHDINVAIQEELDMWKGKTVAW